MPRKATKSREPRGVREPRPGQPVGYRILPDLQAYLPPGQSLAEALACTGSRKAVDLAADSLAVIDSLLGRMTRFLSGKRESAAGYYPARMATSQLQFARIVIANHLASQAAVGLATPHTGWAAEAEGEAAAPTNSNSNGERYVQCLLF